MHTDKIVNWRAYPFIRFLIPYMVGLHVGLKNTNSSYLIMLLIIPLTLIIFKQAFGRSKHAHSIPFTILLFCLFGMIGFLNGTKASQLRHPDHFAHQLKEDPKPSFWKTQIKEVSENQKYYKLKVEVLAWRLDSLNRWKNACGKLQIYLTKSDSVSIANGSMLIFKGRPFRIPKAKNPHTFDFAAYMANAQIHYQVYLKKDQYHFLAHSNSQGLVLWRAKRLQQLKAVWPNPTHHAIFEAMIFGEKSNIPKELKQLYTDVGALHVLAVSGLHVGIILILLQGLFKVIPGLEAYPNIQRIAVLTGIWIYVLIAGAGPSVVRAGTMFSFILLGSLLHRNGNIYNSLAASAFFLLLMQPNWLYSPGFQLSYLAVFGIVYFQKRIYNLWLPSQKWLDFLWKLCSVSLAAQIMTFPISLYYFQQFPVHFWLSGLLIVPLAPLLIFIGGIAFILHQWLPDMIPVFHKLTSGMLDIIHLIFEQIQQLPFSVIQVPDFDELELIGCYLMILTLMIFIKTKHGKWFLTGLSIAILLQIWNTGKEWTQQNQQVFVVYSNYKGIIVDMIYQRSLITVASEEINQKQIEFAASGLRKKLKIKEQKHLTFNEKYGTSYYWQEAGFFQFFALKGAMLSALSKQQSTQIKLDILIIDTPVANTKNLIELIKSTQVQQIIIPDYLKYRERLQISKQLEYISIPIHDVNEMGAYVFRKFP